MGSTKVFAVFFICLIFTLTALPPAFAGKDCGCTPPGHPPYHRPSPPTTPRHPHPHPPKTPKPHPPTTPRPQPPTVKPPPKVLPPIVTPPPVISPPVINPPPIINPPIINPPVITPPPPSSGYPPYTPSPPGGGGPPVVNPPTPTPITKCPIDALKLGLCLDVLGGLVHVIIGDPIENICCPVIQGLLELEAAICLCTTIRLKLLNLNIFLPIALQVLATCGYNPPPGYVCPPLP